MIRENKSAGTEYAVDIVELTKSFQRKTSSKNSYGTIKSWILNIFTKKQQSNANLTNAVKNITMRIPKGASLGVIGKNGSGKSTLLKLITGIYAPTSGHVKVNGRLSALIELGAGFHPDFTGRENIYLGGVMQGLTKEQINERFDEIVEFAELKEVIDDPVRTYSSGMFMRLGFSLAIHTDPEVLLVDEVLAVGDASFVTKCKDKIATLKKKGKTLFLVSHDLEAVLRWSDEVVWLNKGEVMDRGDPRRVIDHYREFIEKGEEETLTVANSYKTENTENFESQNASTEEIRRWGSREVEITDVIIRDSNGNEKYVFHPDDEAIIELTFKLNEEVNDIVFGVGINRADGLTIFGTNTDIDLIKVPSLSLKGKIKFKIKRWGILDGSYTLDVAVHKQDGYPYDYHKSRIQFSIRSAYQQVGVIKPITEWEFNLSESLNA